MECWNEKNAMMDVTPYFLFESTGDSEQVKADADHQEAAMDESECVLFQFDDGVEGDNDEDDDDDDDAQSCSYGHSSYNNTTSYGNSCHDQTQRLIHDDCDDDDDDDDDVDDDKNNNWGDSNMQDRSMQQKGSRNFHVDSSNQREFDRKFWETCLAT